MKNELIDKINDLLKNHTNKNLNEEFVGKDAYELSKFRDLLISENFSNKDLFSPISNVNSGIYKQSGFDLHDEIMGLIQEYIHHYCYNCGNNIPKAYSFCLFCYFRQE